MRGQIPITPCTLGWISDEALNPEREALWARLQSVSFLTDDEKRAVIGYGALSVGASDSPSSSRPEAPLAKFNPNHDELGRFTFADGAASGGGGDDTIAGGSGNDTTGDEQNKPGRPVDILEEEALGGHTFARHVGKTEQYLTARVLGSRQNIPGLAEFGEKRAGSFMSVEAANKLVNSVLAEPQNQQKLKGFVGRGFLYSLPNLYLYPATPFSSPTGYEAYVPNERSQPVIRATNSVEIGIRRTDKSPKGYYIRSAFPLKED